MRKYLLILTVLISSTATLFGQQAGVHLNLELFIQSGTTWNPLSNYRVVVADTSSGGSISFTDIYSDGSGNVDSVYISPYSVGSIDVYTLDCQNNTVHIGSASYDVANGTNYPIMFDTAYVSCVDPCVGNGTVSQNSDISYTFTYENHPNWTGEDAEWSFSSGGVRTGNSVGKVFLSSGTYKWTLTHRGCVVDTGEIVVAPDCDADFIVDTVNSFGGQAVVWNTSVINVPDSVDFTWYFGDGDSSKLAFPSHQYQSPGWYEVTLRVRTYDTTNQNNHTCTSFHSDSLGMDSTGALLYKNGFTLNVMDPNSIGLEENKVDVRLYPQPTDGLVKIETASQINRVTVTDMNGRILKDLSPGHSETQINLSGNASGLYLIRIETEVGSIVEKCILR